MSKIAYAGRDPLEAPPEVTDWYQRLAKARWAEKTKQERSEFARARANEGWRKRRARERIAALLVEVLR